MTEERATMTRIISQMSETYSNSGNLLWIQHAGRNGRHPQATHSLSQLLEVNTLGGKAAPVSSTLIQLSSSNHT